ncbi:sulfate adenylyltransferase subunit CysN [Hydrocarboniclastica marina]|uniref:Sulfate adenylyltransferase subunit 1 n=1 Tax=Hydrocarboniclastica marina TaxID=2259620 RepID=A0A4V1D8W3_9ALTE|nr:sulfate adenylyltransferase subunit CysN [Hydrocarboniclastica marina]QCF26590.1 sulfate adenylyltransferase subunit CysN [Hydrocarboniclastica marina]
MSHQSALISEDINSYLQQHEQKELLRLLTCGSVDDGKSTLIGRLLHDTKMIYEDHLAALQTDSAKVGTTGERLDLALLVDGLQAEREQGITIDVAYRYFSTDKRKFIIADTPGHEQYTRNMATGASTAQMAIILVDARQGVMTQTKRHSFIASLLGIKHVVVAINKMDLVEYSESRFNEIRDDYLKFCGGLNLEDVRFVPMSALEGDNVVHRGGNMSWFGGQTLMEIMESVQIAKDKDLEHFRFPVQYVSRPNLDFRGFCGTISSGVVRKGDTIVALPSHKTSTVKSIVTFDGELDEAHIDQAVTLTLNDEIDISRGDMLVKTGDLPHVNNRFLAHVVWMNESSLEPGRLYSIKQASKFVSGSVRRVHHRIDVNTLEKQTTDQLTLNEIGLCDIALNQPIAFDRYPDKGSTGAFIIIDRLTNVTVGAGMIVEPVDGDAESLEPVTAAERKQRLDQDARIVEFRGDAALQLQAAAERRLFDRGNTLVVLNNENTADAEERGRLAGILKAQGFVVLATELAAVEPDTVLTANSESDIAGALTSL